MNNFRDITETLLFNRYLIKVFTHRQWRSQGERGGAGESSPRNGKNCCRKMMLFPNVLFLVRTFPELVKNSIFLLNFHQQLSKFSQEFHSNICFSSKRSEKLTAWFVKFIEKYSKIMHF